MDVGSLRFCIPDSCGTESITRKHVDDSAVFCWHAQLMGYFLFWVMRVVSGGMFSSFMFVKLAVCFLSSVIFVLEIYGSLCNFTFVQLSPSHPTLHRQVPGFRQYPFCLLHPGLQMAGKGH